LIKKAKAGELVEKPAFEKTENTRMFKVFVDEDCFEVGVEEQGGASVISHGAPAAGTSIPRTSVTEAAPAAAKPEPASVHPDTAETIPARSADTAQSTGTPVTAPMPGMVIRYEKQVGDAVEEGETVVIIEAMKMENALPAPKSGTIAAIHFDTGDAVARDDVLAVID
ncbi:MAG: biotin/lipoyl-containing protein, partial [Thermodesulfobacteriota bacterium]